MRAGKLDQRVTLQNATETHGAMGGVAESWSDVDTVWAQKRDTGGKEFLAADGLRGESFSIFVIRFRTDVSLKSRVVHGGVVWDVQNIKEIGRRQGLELTCKRRQQ